MNQLRIAIRLLLVGCAPMILSGCFTMGVLQDSSSVAPEDKVESIVSGRLSENRKLIVVVNGDFAGFDHRGLYELTVPLTKLDTANNPANQLLPRSAIRPRADDSEMLKKGWRSVAVTNVTLEGPARFKLKRNLQPLPGTDATVYSIHDHERWNGLVFVESKPGDEAARWLDVELMRAKAQVQAWRYLIVPVTVTLDAATLPFQLFAFGMLWAMGPMC